MRMRNRGADPGAPSPAGRIVRGLVVPMALAAACASCAGGASAPPATTVLRPAYDPATGLLSELSFDANGDARFEFTAQVVDRRIQRVDVDEDGDGVPERREHYDVAPNATPRQSDPILRAVEQFDPSGAVRRREGYEAGQLAWVEEDRDGDGRTDRWERWASGALTSVTMARKGQKGDLRILYPASPPARQAPPAAGD